METCDTNILYYALNSNCVENKSARNYLDKMYASDDFAICELVLLELFLLLCNSKLNKKPATPLRAAKIIQHFRQNPKWAIIDYQSGIMNEVWQIVAKPSFSYRRIFDIRLGLTLRYHRIDRLATRNVKDFKGVGIKHVFNPIN